MATVSDYLKRYGALYLRAQSTGNYKMFLFDVKDSKKHSIAQPVDFYRNMIKFVNAVTNDLLIKEKELGKKILHRHLENFDNYDIDRDEDKVVLLKRQSQQRGKGYRYDCQNPLYWMGDLMHFIILRDSISDEEFYSILQKNKDKIIPKYDLHHSKGYYETDAWGESDEKFSRIYCIPILEEFSKQPKNIITSKHVTNEK